MLLYLVPEVDPFFCLALEEQLLCRSSSAWLLLWRNEPSIVLGRNQIADQVVDRAIAEKNAIRVARRLTGGGTVCHDRGNVQVVFITTAKSAENVAVEPFMRGLARALHSLGVPAKPCGQHALEAQGRPVFVSDWGLFKKRLVFHGTLFAEEPSPALRKPLRVPPVPAACNRHSDPDDTVMGAEEFMEQLAYALPDGFEEPLWQVQKPLDEAGMHAVRQLRDDRYAAPEWTFAPLPAFDRRHRVETGHGPLECLLTLHDGCIAHCALHGDFMGLEPIEPLTEALRGCPYEPAAVEQVLTSVPLERYLGAVSRHEALCCLLGSAPAQASVS